MCRGRHIRHVLACLDSTSVPEPCIHDALTQPVDCTYLSIVLIRNGVANWNALLNNFRATRCAAGQNGIGAGASPDGGNDHRL